MQKKCQIKDYQLHSGRKQDATAFNQSFRKFERKLKSYFNLSPQQYIIKLRNHEACDLLGNGSQPIGDIAFDLGFYDQNSFIVQFKKNMEMTPLQYRRQFL
ncbi:MAG: hypothetical protein CMO58_08645 [Verrucomicrobiales bacterium]|nr:hypothetical protein [Verrucomicrobiales bacterium]